MICLFSEKSDVQVDRREDGFHIVIREPGVEVWQECVCKTQFQVFRELKYLKKIGIKVCNNAFGNIFNK